MTFTSFLVLALVLDGQAAAPKPPAPAAPAIPFEEIARRATEAREKDQIEEAIRWYRQGAQLRPHWDEGLWYLGTLLYDQDQYAEARDAFRRFLAVKPDVGPAWGLRGLCEFRLKEYDAALQSLTKGRTLGYGTNTAVQRAAWFHEAILRIRASEFELAVRPLTWLARSEPESKHLVEAAGLMLLRLPKLPDEIPDEKRELVTLAGGFTKFAASNRATLIRQEGDKKVMRKINLNDIMDDPAKYEDFSMRPGDVVIVPQKLF